MPDRQVQLLQSAARERGEAARPLTAGRRKIWAARLFNACCGSCEVLPLHHVLNMKHADTQRGSQKQELLLFEQGEPQTLSSLVSEGKEQSSDRQHADPPQSSPSRYDGLVFSRPGRRGPVSRPWPSQARDAWTAATGVAFTTWGSQTDSSSDEFAIRDAHRMSLENCLASRSERSGLLARTRSVELSKGTPSRSMPCPTLFRVLECDMIQCM